MCWGDGNNVRKCGNMSNNHKATILAKLGKEGGEKRKLPMEGSSGSGSSKQSKLHPVRVSEGPMYEAAVQTFHNLLLKGTLSANMHLNWIEDLYIMEEDVDVAK